MYTRVFAQGKKQLETKVIIKISTHMLTKKLWLIFMGMMKKKFYEHISRF